MKISGGSKLDARLAELSQNVKKAAKVEIGFPEGATEDDGTSIPMIAAIQEFGAPRAGIPPRPFFRTMINAKSGEWPAQVAALLEHNDFDAAKSLGQIGESIAGELRESIIDMNAPALSEVTLMLRQMVGPNGRVTSYSQVTEARERVARGERASGVSTKPLVWTGELLASIVSIVK